jgi:hypothetical protein
MNKPVFIAGEIVYSEKLMGRIKFARVYQDEWWYIIEQPIIEGYELEQIGESEVLGVCRDGKLWITK